MGVINFTGYGANVVGSLGSGSLVQDMPSAMQLNGTNAYASGSTTMSTVTGTTATIAMWVYYTGSQTNQGEKVLFSDSSSETRKILMQTRNHGSHGTSFRYGYVDSAGGGVAAKDTGGSAGVLTSGTWQHFAIVTDGNNVSLHVDGVPYSDDTYASAGTHSYAIARPHLGRAAFSDGRYFPGYIRDVQVYNVSSSTAQLGQIMKGELPHGTPIHWWTCDDGATNDDGSATDSDLTLTNTVQDKSKYHLNQVGVGSVSSSATVSGGTWNLKSSTYVNFDGTGDYIDVGDKADLENNDFTISGWFYIDSGGSGVDFLAAYSDGGTKGWRLYQYNNTLNFYRATSSVNYDISGLKNQWVHIVGTYKSGALKLYINGNLEKTNTPTGSPDYSSSSFQIGADGAGADTFQGKMHNIALYDTELTETQVTLLYQGQWNGNPVGWWKLDDGTGVAVDSGTGGNNGTLTNATWVNPDYEIEMDAGGTPFKIDEDTTLSAPRGNLVLSGTTVNQPTYKIEGIYTHNSGTMIHRNAVDVYWRPSDISKSGVNTFYKFKVEGQKTQWARGSWNVEHSINLQGIMRMYANSSYSEGHTLTLGTTGSQGYVSGSSYMQAMTTVGTPAGSIVQGAHKLYPGLLSGTHATYKGVLAPYRSVQLGNLQFDGKVTNEASMDSPVVTVINDVYFKGGYDAHNGETLVTTNQRARFGKNLIMESGVTFVGSGSLLICDDKIKTDGATVYNSGTSVICGHAGESTIRFNSGDWENVMYNPTGGGVSFDTNTNVANNLIIGGGYYDMTTVNFSGDGVGKLQIVGGGEFRGGDNTTHKITDTFNMAGGFIGKSALKANDTHAAYGTATSYASSNIQSITMSGWFKMNSDFGSQETYQSIYRQNDNFIMIKNDGKVYAGVELSKADNLTWTYPGVMSEAGLVKANKWHHIAATWKASEGLKAYLDGELVAEKTDIDSDYTHLRRRDGTTATVGGRNGTPINSQLAGSVAQAARWQNTDTSAAKSVTQIRNEMFQSASQLSSTTGLYLWFQFDEGNGTSAEDLSPNGTDFTVGTLAKSAEASWIEPGTFTYETCTLKFDKAGTCNLQGKLDGNTTDMYSVHITNGTTVSANIYNSDFVMASGSLMVNSGSLTGNRNWQYKSRNMPIIGASSDLKVGGNIWYYMSDGSGLPASGAGTDYYQLRPATNVYMQGDFDCQNGLLQSGGETHLNGYTCSTNAVWNYGGGDIWAEPGSSIVFDSTKGFEKQYGSNTTPTFVASGEACAIFPGEIGRGGIHDEIDLPAGVLESLPQSSCSISMWVNVKDDDLGTYSGFFGGTPGKQFTMWRQQNNRFMFSIGGSSEQFSIYPTIESGVWYHIGMTYDGTTAKGYFNGNQTGSNSYSGAWTTSVSQIGNYVPGGGNTLDGKIADVRIFPTTLSDANFATLASENPATSVSGAYADPTNSLGAIAWYKLGATTSGTLDVSNYGTSGAAFNGTIDGDVTSGFVTIKGTAGEYNPINNIYPAGVTLQNTYISGSKDIVVGQIKQDSSLLAHGAQFLKTRGRVTLE